ncbi:MAG: zinc transporter ZupT [Brachybacterium sp.]|nr:zinc transporter ZupT [Brachybacterium sp.]
MLTAFLLTVVAGSATSLGALIGISGRVRSDRFLAAGLGFASGVMLYVSFAEILPQGAAVLSGGIDAEPTRGGTALAVLWFLLGMSAMVVIDRLVPRSVGPSPTAPVAGRSGTGSTSTDIRRRRRLLRTGLTVAVVLALHNVPEGFATFVAAMQDPALALPVVFAIAIHNIPEGVAVAVPIHQATGSRLQAFAIASLSGMAEPLGALIGIALFYPLLTGPALGGVLAVVGGVMVVISLAELLPAALEYGGRSLTMCAVIAGMAVMAGSLLLLP